MIKRMDRIDKENYYLDIAETVLERSTCLRRCYGAIIVKNDEIVSTGYNGAPRGRKNCMDLGYCAREAMNVPSGQRYELCRSVHAEMNAIISAARRDTLGSTLYPGGRPRTAVSSTTPPPAPCAAGSSSTRASPGWSSATPSGNTPWSRWRTGYGRTTPCPSRFEKTGLCFEMQNEPGGFLEKIARFFPFRRRVCPGIVLDRNALCP